MALRTLLGRAQSPHATWYQAGAPTVPVPPPSFEYIFNPSSYASLASDSDLFDPLSSGARTTLLQSNSGPEILTIGAGEPDLMLRRTWNRLTVAAAWGTSGWIVSGDMPSAIGTDAAATLEMLTTSYWYQGAILDGQVSLGDLGNMQVVFTFEAKLHDDSVGNQIRPRIISEGGGDESSPADATCLATLNTTDWQIVALHLDLDKSPPTNSLQFGFDHRFGFPSNNVSFDIRNVQVNTFTLGHDGTPSEYMPPEGVTYYNYKLDNTKDREGDPVAIITQSQGANLGVLSMRMAPGVENMLAAATSAVTDSAWTPQNGATRSVAISAVTGSEASEYTRDNATAGLTLTHDGQNFPGAAHTWSAMMLVERADAAEVGADIEVFEVGGGSVFRDRYLHSTRAVTTVSGDSNVVGRWVFPQADVGYAGIGPMDLVVVHFTTPASANACQINYYCDQGSVSAAKGICHLLTVYNAPITIPTVLDGNTTTSPDVFSKSDLNVSSDAASLLVKFSMNDFARAANGSDLVPLAELAGAGDTPRLLVRKKIGTSQLDLVFDDNAGNITSVQVGSIGPDPHTVGLSMDAAKAYVTVDGVEELDANVSPTLGDVYTTITLGDGSGSPSSCSFERVEVWNQLMDAASMDTRMSSW